MTITSYYNANTNATSYLIICPYEGKPTAPNHVEVATKITGMSWI